MIAPMIRTDISHAGLVVVSRITFGTGILMAIGHLPGANGSRAYDAPRKMMYAMIMSFSAVGGTVTVWGVAG